MVASKTNSPCVGVCYVDPATRSCTGCFRTDLEIFDWGVLDEFEKLVILHRISVAKKDSQNVLHHYRIDRARWLNGTTKQRKDLRFSASVFLQIAEQQCVPLEISHAKRQHILNYETDPTIHPEYLESVIIREFESIGVKVEFFGDA